MTEFTPEHITQLVKEHVREALGDDKACSEMTATVTWFLSKHLSNWQLL
ncbi:MAG: hypothetical protein KKD01_13595 [Proteobacteria bacterium]|nr:hypothetical protein [Pseudomonadota bacterium]MBU1455753.1 hypothetical protein [Pseudomonadota bacterium]